MYLDYFGFNEYPFTLTPNTHYFCVLPQYREALNVLLLSIRSGEGFIKVVGEVGTGKTMLCRALLDSLADDYITAYIANPALGNAGLHRALAQELEIQVPANADQYQILTLLQQRLLELNAADKKVVVIIDEAQSLSDEGLEGLRLLSNLETATSKLLQLVLFGQTELDMRLNQTHLRQLQQRIAFSYNLSSLNKEEVRVYVEHRLSKAGNTNQLLFSDDAFAALTAFSRGNPRLINILSHKALITAFGQGRKRVGKKEMRKAALDTTSVPFFLRYNYLNILRKVGLVALVAAIGYELFLLARLFV